MDTCLSSQKESAFYFLISADTGQRRGSEYPQWVVRELRLSDADCSDPNQKTTGGRDKQEANSPISVVQSWMLFTTCCGFSPEVVFSDPRLLLVIPSKCCTSHLCVFDHVVVVGFFFVFFF